MPAALRLNLTGLNDDTAVEAERYQAALAMAEFADSHGFSVVNVEEHHCANNGWLASPLTLASMIAAKTEQVSISVCALLITLYDPVRLAEDIAVIDVVSKGRFHFIAGQGYREVEYAAMDKDWVNRGKAMDHTIETLLKAWTGEPFEYNGHKVKVSPKPVSQPHPFFMVGGMGKNAARRAAKFGLPFFPPSKMPELEALYYDEMARHGHDGGFVANPSDDASMIFIDENPEAAWQSIGPHFLREIQEYSDWRREGVPRPFEAEVESIEALRDEGKYEILTIEQCAQRMRDNPKNTYTVHPLVGGVDLSRAWQCIEDFSAAL